jgi:Ni/Co efflux regulator RcnB
MPVIKRAVVLPPEGRSISMRKALIGMILAAGVLTPVAAGAQNWREHDGPRGNGGGGGHHQSDNNGNDNQNGGRNAEARSQRTEHRQTDSQPQAQPQPQPQVQIVERRGNDGGNNNGGNRNWRGNNDGGRGNSGDGGVRVRRERNNPGSIYPQAWQGDPNDPRLRHYQDLERRNQQSGNDRGNWRNDRNDRNDRNWRGDRNDRNSRNWRNDWNRGWRSDNRYNWNNWRTRNRNVFHLSPYYSPYRDWRYQRFSIGLFLEPLFFDQRYWIDDPWQYRLPEAPYGTEWVRYYNDVILVDVESGEVIDTIYDFFW